jgi:hypothetical protein
VNTSPILVAIRFTLPLLAVLAGIEQVVQYGATHSNVNIPGKVNLIMQHRIDPDLAIFGMSNGLTDFDAPTIEQLTRLKTFNFSQDGMAFVQSRALINEFAQSSPRCRYVVLAETFMTFGVGPALRTPGRFLPYFSSPNIYPVFREIDPDLAWKVRFVPFYSFIVGDLEYYKSSLHGYLTLLGHPPWDSLRQGFFPETKSWDEPSPSAKQTADEYSREERVVSAFSETIALLNRHGKKVVVVVTPIQADCLAMVPSWDSHREKLRSLVHGENSFLDYGDHPIATKKSNFHNCGHLNVHGAESFSRAFVADFLRSVR